MTTKTNQLIEGFTTAFIDRENSSDLFYKPQFLSNNYKEGIKVISSIEDELLECDEFIISVAFVTMSGIVSLLQTFRELESKGVKGKILTTDYLNFSEPKALETLNKFSNIEIRMYNTKNTSEGFHTKGYIFKKGNIYSAIVGSSNLTASALTTNREWNTRIVSTENGEFVHRLLTEFNEFWNSKQSCALDEAIEDYKQRYKTNEILRKKAEEIAEEEGLEEKFNLKPNLMQIGFIRNLNNIFENGENKALLISATGTGKTYASAFAMRELGFKKVLFLVHRNLIAKAAKKSFEKVFEGNKKCGMVTGEYKEFNSDYIFATINTFTKKEIYTKYSRKHFDAIIIDEAHHSPTDSYQEIMKYFEPLLWLGMTATPDRKDGHLEGRNVYEIFNHQIAHEIRLKDAMEEDLLCPFHYFGISDLEVIKDFEAKKLALKEFEFLTSDERVEKVMTQARFFGYSGERVKGLIFCSRIEEANELSLKFNSKGWRTLVLTGSDSEETRLNVIERLVGKDDENALDYILSVDIFSEGVDIPEINQVIMLRSTQSPIVFVQQLGRGLRKAENKEYVVVLDFIGNYQNNYMIPIALSGDRTYNKDILRRYVVEGGRVIPGASTIHFDEITKSKIFDAIDKAKFTNIELIKTNYHSLKNKLGHIPRLVDFDIYGEMDISLIFQACGSYYNFLVSYEKEYTLRLSPEEEQMIKFISGKLANGKRVHELLFMKFLLEYETDVFEMTKDSLANNYGIKIDKNCEETILNMMTNDFPVSTSQPTFSNCIFIEKDADEIVRSKSFSKLLKNDAFIEMVKELLDYGINKYNKEYSMRYNGIDLVLNQKYTYEDVCRLLNWRQNLNARLIGGYKFDEKTNTFPVFINYNKNPEKTSPTILYEDRFIDQSHLIAISKGKRSLKSPDVQRFLNSDKLGIKVPLFVRKNNDKETKEFYYLGNMKPTGYAEEDRMPTTNDKIVKIGWKLDTPVREDIYKYITDKLEEKGKK